VVLGVGDSHSKAAALVDVVVPEPDDLSPIIETLRTHPRAATALAVLLRGSEERSIGDGLVAESAVYSTLQAGPEFESWLASRPQRDRASDERPTVRVDRADDRLSIVLTRPEVHNAFSARMRDELLDALSLAWIDDSIREITLAGDGPSFCSGGDLDEFGTFPDPATAHLIRLTRSVGRAIAAMSERVIARLHGACMGSGIELPAFAGRVIAAPETTIGLPEVAMGLIPGAGGTVSLPRRIGRHRTAWLALSQRSIDASTARDWGLVDAIEDR
jgi:enoyl-CoA hydratase/carnithine racemase